MRDDANSPAKPDFFSVTLASQRESHFAIHHCLPNSSFSPAGGNPEWRRKPPGASRLRNDTNSLAYQVFSCAFGVSKGITVWGCGLDYDGISYSHGFLVLGSRRWREQQTGFARIIPDTRPSGSLRSRPVDSWRSRRFFPPAGENDE